MKTTREYFKNNLIDLLVTNQYGYTREENLLFNEGLEVVFFDDEKDIEDEKEEFEQYIEEKGYEVKVILKTINERIAYVLI